MFLLIPCLCCLGVYMMLLSRKGGKTRSEMVDEGAQASLKEQPYEPLVSSNAQSSYFRSGLGGGLGNSFMGSFKTKVRLGSVIDAQPLRAPYDPRDNGSGEDDRRVNFLMCCTTKRPPLRRKVDWATSVQATHAATGNVP
eukprot:UN1502